VLGNVKGKGLRERIRRETNRRVWLVNVDQLPRLKRWAVMSLRIGHAVVRELLEGHLNLRAMSLVYTTLLSLIPLLALAFTIFKAFGAYRYLEPLLANTLAPLGPKANEIVSGIINFVANVKVGVMGAVGVAMLLYTSVSLMQKIERSFNYAWHVRYHRRLIDRYRDYLAALMVGPVLVVVAFGITANILANTFVQRLLAFAPVGALYTMVTTLLPFLLVVAAFTVFYVLIPNTRVKLRAAFAGAMFAAVMWEVVGWVFTAFIAGSARYDIVYSALAGLIVFMVWIYISWLILLVGAVIAYYVQNPEHLAAGEHEVRLSNVLAERLALGAMYLIGQRYYDQEKPWTVDDLAHHCHVPADAMASVVEPLEHRGLLAHTDDDPPALLPATPPDTTPVKRILDVIRSDRGSGAITLARVPTHPQVAKLFSEVDSAVDNMLHDRTLKDLVEAGAETDESPPAEKG
jgi:membrane protein